MRHDPGHLLAALFTPIGNLIIESLDQRIAEQIICKQYHPRQPGREEEIDPMSRWILLGLIHLVTGRPSHLIPIFILQWPQHFSCDVQYLYKGIYLSGHLVLRGARQLAWQVWDSIFSSSFLRKIFPIFCVTRLLHSFESFGLLPPWSDLNNEENPLTLTSSEWIWIWNHAND